MQLNSVEIIRLDFHFRFLRDRLI